MLKKFYSTIILCTATVMLMKAQTGALKVTVKEAETGFTIPGAIVSVELNGVAAGKPGATDIDGNVIIKPLNPGSYSVKAQYFGRQTSIVEGVTVSSDKTTYLNVDLAVKTEMLKTVNIVKYVKPLIDPDTKSGGTVTRQEYQAMATKSINSVAATTAGVYQADEGSSVNMRGGRNNSTVYFVDGVKVIGNGGVPQSAVEQVTAITGGVPAQYGDLSGGAISITTRGPQSKYSGGVEAISSQFLDAYGYNFLGFNVGGPIITKKDSGSEVKKSVLGFFLSGQLTSVKDADPSAIGIWKVKDDVLSELEENPLRPASTGVGFLRNSEFITQEDLENIKYKQNSASRAIVLNGKLQWKLGKNTNIIVGGNMNYSKRHAFLYNYSMFNSANNPVVEQNTWSVWTRLTQRFGGDDVTEEEDQKSSSVIKDAFYSIQANYTRTKGSVEDDTHADRYFEYGYIGKFNTYRAPVYAFLDQDQGPRGEGFYLLGHQDTLMTFEPGTLNPKGVKWTESVYNNLPADQIVNFTSVQNNLGLMNGDNPTLSYSLWWNSGTQYTNSQINDDAQFRIFTNFSGDIKKHQIKVGLEFEQRDNRNYNINPVGLWTIMRQYTNDHIRQLDTANPIIVPELSGTYNTYHYNQAYDGSSQAYFDKSLRSKLGLAENGTEWLDLDSYDPSLFSLDMFSADELIQHWSSANPRFVSYYGYDHTGKRLKNNPSFDDFFTAKDENGNFTRLVPSFQPIYMAGYIEDNFDYKDIKMRVGVRVDRYDANQKMLKDLYLYDEAYTAGETDFGKFNTTRPENIGDDYVVYVNDIKNPTGISGYRKDNNWYDATGKEVADPDDIATATGIAPYLVNPNNEDKISAGAFKDYVPQVNIMPRIAFSFPISDMANFFAHYDILTQRPTDDYNRLNILNMYYIETRQGGFVPNPGLRPERTTDYELGFSQILNEKKNSALTLSAFYREMRDMQQIIRLYGAYPISYLTMGNVDFGTVKGFEVKYDLRRTKGVQMQTNYTLQFADGTGSSATDGFNLVNQGLPNLRTLVPLNYDRRHNITMVFDYRFGRGTNYRGPRWTSKKGDKEKTRNIFENVGANVTLNTGSGTPYSAQSNVTQDVAIGISQRSVLEGSIKGSRLPWTFRADVRIDKNFNITWGGKDDAKEGEPSNKKTSNLNVYLQVLNALNNKNVLAVYRYTGTPDDDGYLSDPASQLLISNIQPSVESYRDLYAAKVNNPGFYTMPRRIRLGLLLDF